MLTMELLCTHNHKSSTNIWVSCKIYGYHVKNINTKKNTVVGVRPICEL